MRCILLLALNTCSYLGEVLRFKWADIDFKKRTLCSRREKTGIIRIACLWDETIDAINKLERKGAAIFVGERGPANYKTVYKRFAELRDRAKLPHVQTGSFRDGAYTAVVEAGIDINLARLLAGHATGISDHYLARRPTMVQPACDAVRKQFFG
jgi:integrase